MLKENQRQRLAATTLWSRGGDAGSSDEGQRRRRLRRVGADPGGFDRIWALVTRRPDWLRGSALVHDGAAWSAAQGS
jgi:hypothetical protein